MAASMKIAVPLDDISPCFEGGICIGGEGKKHQTCAIWNGTEHVYIYENMTRMGVLHLPSRCHCMCVFRDVAGEEYLMCGLSDGRIIHQSLKIFKEDVKSKKRKKKKDKQKSRENPQAAAVNHQGSGDNIFTDLLEGDEATPSGSHAPPLLEVVGELPENVFILGDSHVVLNEPNVQDLISVNGCLVTCAKCTAGWTLSVYHPEIKGPLGHTAMLHQKSARLEFQKSPSFRTFLPESGMESSSHGERTISQSGASYCLGDSRGFEVEGSGESKKPQLFCVVSKSMYGKEDTPKTAPGRSMILEDSLYNQFFCSDFNFLDLPIILLSLPDGHIYYSPLRKNGNIQASRSEQVRTGSSRFGQKANLFYVLDQPAASIHGFNTRLSSEGGQENRNTNNQQYGCDCVCIVGQLGKVVQITENKPTNQKETRKFSESHVKGPVQTICRTRAPHTLLYSTGKEIYSLDFSSPSKPGASSAVQGCGASSSFLLAVGKVRVMAVVGKASKDPSYISPILALTDCGRVLKLHPSIEGAHGNRHPPITAVAAGKRMQELLQANNNISDRTSELAKLGKAQDRVLREMSQACHVAGALLSNHNTTHNSSLFASEVHSQIRNDGAVCNLKLLCQLTNRSKWSLSHGWSLVVSVNANPDWPKLEEDAKCHVTKSIPLVNFRPIQTIQLIFPLQHGNTTLALPIDVQTFLHFSPQECMRSNLPEGTTVKTETHFEVGECGILLPLTQPKVIDLLSVLRPLPDHHNPAQGVVPYQTSRNRGPDWLASVLKNAASVRPTANRMACTNLEKTSDLGSVSVGVNISAEVAAMIRQHRSHGTHAQELSWLLHLESNKLATHPANPSRLVTPDAKAVTFQVRVQSSGSGSRNLGQESRQREEAVEIVITAPDYLTLSQLHLALNRRIKMVLESVGKGKGIIATQDRLQKELRKIQVLKTKLASLQDNMFLHDCNDQQCTHNPFSTATLELYQQMKSQLTLL